MFAVTLVLLTCSWQVKATLTFTPTVACPGDIVTFTCTLPGSFIQWTATQGQVTLFVISLDTFFNTDDTQGNPAFRGVLTNSSGPLTATLTSLSEASIVEGIMVKCVGEGSREDPLPITVADPPSPQLNTRVYSAQNQPNFSNITLEWDPPSSTGGVSVSYVLTISPTPLSGSPVTVETTSAQITLSYNISYNVTVRAVNCAGMSNESQIVDIIVCPTPSTAAGVIITNTPTVTIGGSMLTFTCSGDNEVRTSTCGSSGWSPDPGTFVCNSPVSCGSPAAPSRGSEDVNGGTPPFPLGSEVTYRCEEGLFPPDVRTSTCTGVGGRGEWVENPESLVCREMPVNCTVPAVPSNTTIVPSVNGTVVNYERLNKTVLEGTVLSYQCDNVLSLTGPNNITCTNAGVWSTEPEAIMCVLPTTDPPAAVPSIGPIVGGIVGGILVLVCLLVIVVIALLLLRRQKSYEHNEDMVEMSGLQGEYSELRHDGPIRESKKAQHPAADSEGYSRINRNPDAGTLTYDEVVINSDNKIGVNSEGYSVMNTGQTPRLPGYGQLNNVATVEPVVYAALSSSQPRNKINTTATVDQHQVTYATVDVNATREQAAKAATLPTASAPAPADVDKLLDIDQALVQIRSMNHKWRELAETVRLPETLIEQIEDARRNDNAGCLTEVIDQWMKSCSGQPTWRELADHLSKIGEEQLAKELMTIYDTGRLPVELNMKAVPNTAYKYDRAPPPPVPSRSPKTKDDSPGLPKFPSRHPKPTGEMVPARPPKPAPNSEPQAPPRPSKQYTKH